MPNWITLQHYKPLPSPGRMLTEHRFSTAQTSMVITTTRDHGMESCQIGYPQRLGDDYPSAWLQNPLDEWWPFGHVTVADGVRSLFVGRASRAPKYIGGHVRAVTAAGYWEALNDFYFSSSDATTTTSGEIIKAVLLQCPISITTHQEYWTDPGVAHAPNEFDGQRGGSIIQSLLNEGNGTPLDLQLWPGPNGTLVAWLVDRDAPNECHYSCEWVADPQIVDVSWDPQQLFGHVRARYTPSGSSETVTDWTPSTDDTSFSDVWGFDRYLETNAGQMTAGGAIQLAATTQAVQSQQQWSGTIRCNATYPLTAIDGRPYPHAYVRAGQWVRLRGLAMRDGTTSIALQIQQTTYDAGADTLELTVAQGMTRRSLQERMVETVAAVRTGRNPVSAAKAS